MKNWWTATFGLAVSVPFVILWLVWSLERSMDSANSGIWEIYFISFFFPFGVWIILKFTYFPKVELAPGKVVVKNVLAAYEIPVASVRAVRWDDGLALYLNDGKRVYSFGFGGSLLAEIFAKSANLDRVRKIKTHVLAEADGGENGNPLRLLRRSYLNLSFFLMFVILSFVLNISVELLVQG
ncbi:hypothetical protein [Nocardiopsis valliformis]|uniref:hypothetical protein n=1 Tax=Nocardiopsis valliformis TaxID=239974 RepID=UPI001267CE85|nr:hypothetical protein [Nocardiopsis valliformis]